MKEGSWRIVLCNWSVHVCSCRNIPPPFRAHHCTSEVCGRKVDWWKKVKVGGIDKKKANFMEGVAERCLRVSHECHMRSSDLEGPEGGLEGWLMIWGRRIWGRNNGGGRIGWGRIALPPAPSGEDGHVENEKGCWVSFNRGLYPSFFMINIGNSKILGSYKKKTHMVNRNRSVQ